MKDTIFTLRDVYKLRKRQKNLKNHLQSHYPEMSNQLVFYRYHVGRNNVCLVYTIFSVPGTIYGTKQMLDFYSLISLYHVGALSQCFSMLDNFISAYSLCYVFNTRAYQ